MSYLLENIDGVLRQMDNILVYAAAQDQHEPFSGLEEAGLILNAKCEFCRRQVKFLGQIMDETVFGWTLTRSEP